MCGPTGKLGLVYNVSESVAINELWKQSNMRFRRMRRMHFQIINHETIKKKKKTYVSWCFGGFLHRSYCEHCNRFCRNKQQLVCQDADSVIIWKKLIPLLGLLAVLVELFFIFKNFFCNCFFFFFFPSTPRCTSQRAYEETFKVEKLKHRVRWKDVGVSPHCAGGVAWSAIGWHTKCSFP